MKTINVTFEDEEFDLLETAKPEDISWRTFILTLVKNKKEVITNGLPYKRARQ